MRRRTGAVLLAAGLAGSILPIVQAGPTGLSQAYAAEPAPCSEETLADSEVLADSSSKVNPAHDRMHVSQAQEISNGEGIRVAVIDSGIQPGLGINQSVPGVALPGLSPILLSGHGTIVAGLIAGPDGVAPAAQVIDVRVFDSADADVSQGEKGVTSQGITDGIRAAIELHRTNPFQVVNIALSVGQDDSQLREAVKALLELDVVVVASAGNVATESEATTFEGTPGSDADVYPADYPGVLAVSATPPAGGDPRESVLPNKDTDVAAPTYGAISLNVNSQRCDIDQVATSWAAAEVSGVIALLRARFPGETAKQVVARLMTTTEGSDRADNPWTGAGVVQAHDALTRALDPGRSGKIERSVQTQRNDTQAPPPPEQIDLFSTPRALLLWFGLAGGVLIALASMLRSLTRR